MDRLVVLFGGLFVAVVSHALLAVIGVSYFWVRLPAVMLILAFWFDYAEKPRHG